MTGTVSSRTERGRFPLSSCTLVLTKPTNCFLRICPEVNSYCQVAQVSISDISAVLP